MTTTVAVFIIVYLGMMLGRFPGLALDRTGVALLGGVALVALGEVSPEDAWRAVDVPTISLLLGLMVVSAQFRLGGFYAALTQRLAAAPLSPGSLLALLMTIAGLLSALLTNDIVCLAMAPLLIEGCERRSLNPLPYLLGLACASNIGSAATLVGNPQNILIGQALDTPFAVYTLEAIPVVAAAMAIAWIWLCWMYRNRWHTDTPPVVVEHPPFNAWQSLKGCLVLVGAVVGFLIPGVPREIVALSAAGLLLVSRRMHTRDMLGLVDWQLLVLFAGLFVVNHAFAESGALAAVFTLLGDSGIPLESPAWLFGASAVLSNLVSNVPAVMLLLPAATHPDAALILALSSTLVGNLIVVSSIANIIVIEQARLAGVKVSWGDHARAGVPITLVSLLLAASWIMLLFQLKN
jgi:Na+/H+ antiporter NhaD/arsenite permease-like protein